MMEGRKIGHACVLGAVLATTSPAGAWEAHRGEEDWGPMCFLQDRSGFVTVGFYAAPGDSPLATIEGASLPEDATVTWIVDDALTVTLKGSQNDYFGLHEFPVSDPRLLDAIKSGRTLRIAIDRGPAMNVSLKGSGKAVADFERCLAQR
ncbi:hypothetical protein [Jiella sonneratiae]|uniref:Invasion associated locus B family protein n=1 Tax=Jiella sonneratiae TaxID=2816856 RepID=A0ABS3J2B9_9HYPH|nr:hypothetical protein [Jiella sonneratiae]MBO0903816.1 hypothetical protein [Jiella sonneratiae]